MVTGWLKGWRALSRSEKEQSFSVQLLYRSIRSEVARHRYLRATERCTAQPDTLDEGRLLAQDAAKLTLNVVCNGRSPGRVKFSCLWTAGPSSPPNRSIPTKPDWQA